MAIHMISRKWRKRNDEIADLFYIGNLIVDFITTKIHLAMVILKEFGKIEQKKGTWVT